MVTSDLAEVLTKGGARRRPANQVAQAAGQRCEILDRTNEDRLGASFGRLPGTRPQALTQGAGAAAVVILLGRVGGAT